MKPFCFPLKNPNVRTTPDICFLSWTSGRAGFQGKKITSLRVYLPQAGFAFLRLETRRRSAGEPGPQLRAPSTSLNRGTPQSLSGATADYEPLRTCDQETQWSKKQPLGNAVIH